MSDEDAEEILLVALRLSLRDVGGVEVRNLNEVTASVLVSIVVRSVLLIEEAEGMESQKMSATLPKGAASRHRLCTLIASRLNNLGFEIGYNQLLYPQESSTRAVLTWLVDRLPRGDEERAAEAMDASTAWRTRIADSVAAWTKASWKLPPNRAKGRCGREWRAWGLEAKEDAALVTQQVPSGADFLPSLLELAAKNTIATAHAEAAALSEGVANNDDKQVSNKSSSAKAAMGASADVDFGWGSRTKMPSLGDMLAAMETGERSDAAALGRLAHAAWFKHGDEKRHTEEKPAPSPQKKDKDEGETTTEEAPAPSAEAEAASLASKLSAELEQLGEAYAAERQKAVRIESEREALERQVTEATAKLDKAKENKTTLEREYVVRKKTLDMLPEASAAIAKLREICQASRQRLVALEAEWTTHREPLEKAIEAKRQDRGKRKATARAMVDEMKRCRNEMQQMVLDLASKEDRAKLLEAEYAKMPKNVNRTLYTYRIMDIIQSVAKQKAEIAKIIEDIKGVQKDNNKVSEALTRSEAIADETVHQASADGKDPSAIQAYRYLCDLRQLFETLVSVISQTSAEDRKARDLDSKSKQLQTRLDANNLKRILDDLQQVKAENDKLISKLKAHR